jgi:phosphoserine phosphatase
MTQAKPTFQLTSAAGEFISSVVAVRPRLAAFDCDGTLWPDDSGQHFFYWQLRRRLLPPDVARWIEPRYDDYLAGKVDEATICGEMVTINAGLKAADLQRWADEFFAAEFAATIFPEMRELVARLQQDGCEIWAVSSTNDWVVRAGVRGLGISDDHVLAACVHCTDGVVTDRLIRVPTDEFKAVAIREVVGRPMDAVFGNSIHDAAMLEIARHPFAVNPNSALQRMAAQRGWPVYFPVGTAGHECR